MHVAMISPYSMSAPGGAQQHARGLARQLVRMGHEVTLFGPELRGEQPDLEGVGTVSLGGTVRIPANGSIAPLGIDPRMLIRFDLALDPADVIHVHEAFLPACLAAVARRPKGTAVVGTFHMAAERFWAYSLAAPLLRRVVKRFDAFTAVSPAARATVRRYVPVDPEIVPNGIDCDSFEKAGPDAWAASLGTVVLFIGRPEPRKGFDVAARAFADVAADHPEANLVMSIDEADLPSGVSRERIHCIGRGVDVARRNALHAAADIVLCPATSGESFGLVVVEGLAGGSAVISSDIPGYMFAGGDAAVYARAGDVASWRETLGSLLSDVSERARLAKAGPERAREFDWPNIAARTVDVYERAAAR